MATDDELVIKTEDKSYEGRSVFARYQSVLAALAAVATILAFVGPIVMNVRDTARDAKMGVMALTARVAQHESTEAQNALREETDLRRTNDEVIKLGTKVDLLIGRKER